MEYIKINYDETKPLYEVVDLPKDTEGFLEACYRHLHCGCIEVVPTVLKGIYLIIDESGKLKDGWQSRINKEASRLYGSWWDKIVGDAILAKVRRSDLVPLTLEEFDSVLHYGES